jgi:hypothetical protein
MSQKAERHKKKNHSNSAREKYVLGCSDKARYRSREKAADHLVSIRYKVSAGKSEGGSADRFPVRAYSCNNCRGFHLSSAPQRFQDLGLVA